MDGDKVILDHGNPFVKVYAHNLGGNEYPNTFEEFLEPEEYIDHGHLFTTDRIFNSKDELVDWAKQTAMKANTYFIINPYQKSRTSDRRPYVILACERRVTVRKKYETNNLRRSSCNRLTSSGRVMCRFVISYDFFENKTLVIYVVHRKYTMLLRKIKRNRKQGRNTVEEVLCLSTQRGYTVFYRNREESNVLKRTSQWQLLLCAMNRLQQTDEFFNKSSQIAKIKTSLEISKLKGKYGAKSNPILKNISNNISHLALKKIWLEIKRAREIFDDPQNRCGHNLRKSHGLPYEISTGPISKVRKVRRLIKGVISRCCLTILVPLTISLKLQLRRDDGRRIQAKGISLTGSDGNCGFKVVANFIFRDENQWPKIRRRMSNDLHHHMNMYVSLFGSVECVDELIKKTCWEEDPAPYEHWLDTPDHLYVIANTFNFFIVLIVRLGSTTVLPLYSNMDCTARMLCIGFISDQQHFIQVIWSNGNIIEMYESVGGHNLIMNRLQSMPCGYSAIPNLLKFVQFLPNLISYHHIQPQTNVQ
ncbi:hypothetical protein M9H77_18427 [Catharanthus roseus]|uniref:Uncharacterized protein n=1 Tax=Catharanthus roseus TaxID=4058 RepID=A0ACC0B7G9_CATRO|nr:hypothetical protein M9H77_18427 [Catharanthus roseus]